jgi:hypothetical protein
VFKLSDHHYWASFGEAVYGRGGETSYAGGAGVAGKRAGRLSQHDHHDHHVADHHFMLRALVDRAHAGKQAVAAFVDFSKAFDTIPRDLLWRRMQEIGLHGEMRSAL